MSEKSQAFGFLRGLINRIELQLGQTVRILKLDGGGEFDRLTARPWYQTAGIWHYVANKRISRPIRHASDCSEEDRWTWRGRARNVTKAIGGLDLTGK